MTRKDYERAAEIVRVTLTRERLGEYVDTSHAIAELASGLADWFAQDNPRFVRSRFMGACGVE